MSGPEDRSLVDRVVDDLMLASELLPAGREPEPEHTRADDGSDS